MRIPFLQIRQIALTIRSSEVEARGRGKICCVQPIAQRGKGLHASYLRREFDPAYLALDRASVDHDYENTHSRALVVAEVIIVVDIIDVKVVVVAPFGRPRLVIFESITTILKPSAVFVVSDVEVVFSSKISVKLFLGNRSTMPGVISGVLI